MGSWVDRVNRVVGRSRDVVVSPYHYDDDKSAKAILTDPVWVAAPLYGAPRRIDYTELEQYELDVTVSAAVGFIVDSIATCEWDIVPDEDLDEDDDPDPTEAIKFFNSADWEDSFETVLRGVVTDTIHYDCGTMVVVFPEFCYDEHKTLIKTGVPPLQLRARDGRSFMRQVSPHGDILSYWQYSFAHQAAAPIEFTKDEIIYIQEKPSTRSPYGTAKLQIVQNVTDLMMAIQLGHRSEQENNLNIGGTIAHVDITDPERLKHLSEMYNSKLQGERNKKKWLVTGGNVEINPVNSSDIDDSWVGGVEWYQMQILSIFKVPRTILGFTSSDVNRATSISQATTFKRLGTATMMTLLERIFTREIVKKYFNDKLVFRFKREVDIGDEVIRAEIDAKNVATGLRTVNELRVRDGLEEIEEPEDDDEGYEFGDEYGEFDNPDGQTPDESAEIGKGLDINFGKTTVHVPASGGRVAYDYERVSGKGDDKESDLKAKVGMFGDLGNALKTELKSLIDKLTSAGITPEGKQKIGVIKNKMDTAYANRDAAIKAWEKHTGKKWTDKKPADKKTTQSKAKPGDKKERKPQSEEAKAKAAETRRLREDVVKYQAEGDALKKEASEATKKYTTDGKMSAEGKKTVDALTKKMDAAYKHRDDAKKALKDVDVQIDPREGITGFSDDFISIYDIDMAIKDYMFGEGSMTRSEYDVANKKFQTMLNSYGRDKYTEDHDKYQRIVDQKKKAAGIAIDPYNRTPVTDSAVFNLKDGKTTLGDMDASDAIKQLEAGGWNFERASFGFDEDSDFTNNTAVVENGIVCGVYDTVEHTDSFELRTLQVNADMQRLGHGKKIMGHVIQDAIDSKKGKLSLHSLNSDSNKFYEAIGMKKVPGQPGGYEGDMTWMKEYLGALKNV